MPDVSGIIPKQDWLRSLPRANESCPQSGLDVVYIAASERDARFTRICVASVRYFYPDVAIELMAGGPLQSGLAEELQRHWNVGVANLPVGDYGWGFIKLEPLFKPAGQRFMILDSDTVLTGPVLDIWRSSHAPFLVDREAQSEADTRRLYYDWQKVREVDPDARPPRFVFNSGQWFGTADVLTRDDFAPWLEWTMPRRLRYPQVFMPGDQGILNYVLNQKAALGGLAVENARIMHWPGFGMDGLDAKAVAAKSAPPMVVHWAGMKKARLSAMVGADLLTFFEKRYYQRIPCGEAVRLCAGMRHALSHWLNEILIWLRLRIKILRGRYSSS